MTEMLEHLPSAFFWRRRLMIETTLYRLHGVIQSISMELDAVRRWATREGVDIEAVERTPPMMGRTAPEARKLGMALVFELERVKHYVREAGLIPPRTRMDPCEACVKGLRPKCEEPCWLEHLQKRQPPSYPPLQAIA